MALDFVEQEQGNLRIYARNWSTRNRNFGTRAECSGASAVLQPQLRAKEESGERNFGTRAEFAGGQAVSLPGTFDGVLRSTAVRVLSLLHAFASHRGRTRLAGGRIGSVLISLG